MHIYTEIDPQVRVDQGDVFVGLYFHALEAEVNAVVINPTCDIEHGKASFIKFVSTVPTYVVVRTIADSVGINESSLQSEEPLPKNLFDRLIKAIRRNVNGDFLPRFYLMPAFPDIFPISYLDFQRVFVIPFLQVEREYMGKRAARIVSPWREEILTRYAGYSTRVGVPDYSDDDLKDVITSTGIIVQTE